MYFLSTFHKNCLRFGPTKQRLKKSNLFIYLMWRYHCLQTLRTDPLGISRNSIATKMHLTHQDLHVNIPSFGLLERVLEPPLHTIGNDF